MKTLKTTQVSPFEWKALSFSHEFLCSFLHAPPFQYAVVYRVSEDRFWFFARRISILNCLKSDMGWKGHCTKTNHQKSVSILKYHAERLQALKIPHLLTEGLFDPKIDDPDDDDSFDDSSQFF